MTVSYDTSVHGKVVRAAIAGLPGSSILYLLTESKISDGDTDKLYTTYSIYSASCSDENDTETSFIVDITCSVSDAYHLFDLISEGSVTPCTLMDIVSDYMVSA